MAQKTIVTLVDDVTGEEAEDISTVEFALDGVNYEIDLGGANAAALRDALAGHVAAARKTGGRRRSGPGRRGAANTSPTAASSRGYSRETLRSIREWAKKNGHDISDRGRLPAEVLIAWEAANRPGTPGNGTPAPSFSG